MKRIAHLVWKILLLESAVLLVVALVWRWTGWHSTADYGFALVTAGGIMIFLGLLGVAARGSSKDMHLRKAAMDMPNRDAQHQRRYTPTYTESTRVWFWLISLGVITIITAMVLKVFFL
jgi:hypothetical protein